MGVNFESTTASLIKGMEEFITTKTVVGEPVYVRDTTLVPLVEVSFGMMASDKAESARANKGGGMGGKISPTAVLIISRDGATRLVSLKNQDGISKVIDMMPDLVNRFTSGRADNDPQVKAAVKNASKEETF